MKVSDLDKKFDDNKEDVLEYFDLSSTRRINQKQKRINVDVPEWVINSLDREANRIGVTRQSIIKMWLVERLETQEANKANHSDAQ